MKNKTHKPYQPKLGLHCFCKRGIERDNCPRCEGTGMQIDFAAIRNRNKPTPHAFFIENYETMKSRV